MTKHTGWNWSKVPAEMDRVLKGDAQIAVFRLLREGHTHEKIAILQAVGLRRIGYIVAAIKLRLDACGYKYGGEAPPVQHLPEHHVLHPELRKEKLTTTEEHHLKARVRTLEQDNKTLRDELAKSESLLAVAQRIQQQPVVPLKMKVSKPNKPKVAATAMLSDTHFDEVVTLEEIGGVNEYNREIATRRLKAFAEKAIIVSQELMSGFNVTHLDLPFGGDMVSGNIHEELARTNQAEIMDTVDYWSQRLAEIVVTLAKEFPTVFIPCVVGNHGRNTKKPRHKGRVRDNFDWLIYRSVQRNVQASGVRNVSFEISESTDVLWSTMGHGYLLTHGDQASGGAGWGGIFSPIMRLYEKKLKAYASRGLTFDYLMMGHWHQFIDAGAVIVNGSTKGYDEFAHNLNFRAEPPQQAFWLTDPKHGKIFSGPLFLDAPAAKSVRKAA